MQMKFVRQLPIPQEIKEEFPVSLRVTSIREKRLGEMRAIFRGRK